QAQGNAGESRRRRPHGSGRGQVPEIHCAIRRCEARAARPRASERAWQRNGEMETMTSTGATTKNGAEPAKGAKTTARRPKGAGVKTAKPAKAAKAPPPTKAQEIIEALRAASRDKDIDEDRLIAGFEEAMATAVRKVSKVREVMARFDKKTGELTAWT